MPAYWVPMKPGKNIPKNAVEGGNENGEIILYVGRILNIANHPLPGKVVPVGSYKAFTTFEGDEVSSDEFEILCGDDIAWTSYKKCHGIPDNALVASKTHSGQELYIGRAKHEDHLIPGKVSVDSDGDPLLHIPYDGTDYHYDEFEILVEID